MTDEQMDDVKQTDMRSPLQENAPNPDGPGSNEGTCPVCGDDVAGPNLPDHLIAHTKTDQGGSK